MNTVTATDPVNASKYNFKKALELKKIRLSRLVVFCRLPQNGVYTLSNNLPSGAIPTTKTQQQQLLSLTSLWVNLTKKFFSL